MRRPSTTLFALSLSAALLAACNDDGRTLRPAAPDQTASVSTSSTTAPPTIEELEDGGDATTTTVIVTDTHVGVDIELHAPWAPSGALPADLTCDGANTSPALSWTPVPEGTGEIAISLVGTSTNTVNSGIHWLVAGISADTLGIEAGMIPLGAVEAALDDGTIGYTGPCPTAGTAAEVTLTVHFLERPSGIADGDPAAAALAAITQSELASVSLKGSFSRP